jgi:hypothetical protein
VDAVPPDVLDDAPRRGPGITMFGRLAPGATLDDARAELAALGRRAARELPDTHRAPAAPGDAVRADVRDLDETRAGSSH